MAEGACWGTPGRHRGTVGAQGRLWAVFNMFQVQRRCCCKLKSLGTKLSGLARVRVRGDRSTGLELPLQNQVSWLTSPGRVLFTYKVGMG